jgi:hypothetical protein
VIINGCVRDSDEIAELKLGVKAIGTWCVRAHSRRTHIVTSAREFIRPQPAQEQQGQAGSARRAGAPRCGVLLRPSVS